MFIRSSKGVSLRKIQVAVGTTRRPKLNAVWEALTVFGPSLDSDAQFDVVGVEVESGVAHTPLSREESMAGARQRAEALVQQAKQQADASGWRYFVGLEGGLDVVYTDEAGGQDFSRAAAGAKTEKGASAPEGKKRLVFLENWAYVTDGTRSAYGQSGGILIPAALAVEVVDKGVELATAIDAFAGGQDIRSAQGAWGVFTKNLITRQDAFRTAVINAFAPFFNSALYR